MKKLILLLLIVFTANISHSQYTTPNTGVKWNMDSLVAYSAGVVTYSDGNYLINSNLFINTFDTLAITNNCIIKVGNGLLIDVYGVLKVTPPDSVKMTAQDTAVKYIGMRFEDSSDVSVLKKFIFEYANSIRLLRANITIDSCTLRYNTLVNNAGSGAISLSSSSPTISNSKIFRNRRSAIISPANGGCSPIIINNLIYENGVNNENYPQINLGPGDIAPIIIKNNTVTGLTTSLMVGGIGISNLLGSSTITTALIENNIVKHNRFGIAFTGANLTGVVSGNVVDSNNIQNNPSLGGSGLNFNSTSTTAFQTVKVKRNIVRGNLWGVTIQGKAKPNFGDLSSNDTNLIGLNEIYNNNNSSQQFIDFFNNTPDSIKAENNYWGSINLDTVESHIFHNTDSIALGFVDYLPIWASTSITTPVINYPSTFNLYEAYPNPFNPMTEIKFDVSKASFISIKVYDITGRVVGELANSYHIPGTYSVYLDAGKFGLSSGVYFVRMTATNDFAKTLKVLLIK